MINQPKTFQFNTNIIKSTMETIDQQLSNDVVVIMVPFPCQSHLNQLLHLSCLISSYKIPVHYAGSTTHVQQARDRYNKKTTFEFAQIEFHEFATPEFVSPPPNHSMISKFPSHLYPSFESSISLREPMTDLFRKISPLARRVVVIHDIVMCYTVQDGATFPNVELYAFNPVSAFSCYYDGRDMSPSNYTDETPEGLPSGEGCIPADVLKLIFLQISHFNLTSGVIFNSCRSIEGTYIDLVGNNEFTDGKRQWAIGPLNVGTVKTQHECLDWLGKQTPNSVIYVSFGTTVSMSNDEIKEIALGLEQSRQKFIWVLRDADRGNIFEGHDKKLELPQGFEDRTKGVGIVVRDWAPQLEILEHSSIGGFLSHCGWNSCLESITMGVPVAAWPMHADQPRNAYLLTNVLKIGVTVREWEHRDELVTSSVIAKSVETLMVSNEGAEMRERAQNLGCLVQEAVKEGGVSQVELNSLIAHITR